MAFDFRRFVKGILLKGESSDPTDNLEGSMWANSTANRIKAYINSAIRVFVTEDESQSLTNKTIDADNNTISNLAHGAEVDNPTSGVHGVTGNVVGTSDTQSLTNKTLDGVTINTAIIGTAVESNLNTSASASKVPSAAAAKSYIDDVESSLNSHIIDTNTHGITSTIAGVDETQTFTNKTINAAQNTISGLSHGSEVDNPSSGVHGVTGSVVGTSDIQSLTNKTIDGNNNTISNLAHGSEVDSPSSGVHGVTGDVVGSSDIQTITNKTIDADNNTISNLAHGAEVDNPTSGVHGVTGSVVGTSDSQTLSNKEFSDAITQAEISTPSTPSTSKWKIYPKTDGYYQLDDAGTETKLAGGGATGINFVDNGQAKSDTTGWTTFDDAGSYVDGTGGSPSNVTWTRVTATPLVGSGSFRFTKSASDASGEGVSYDYTITEAHKAEAQKIRFYYKPSSTYVNEEMEVRIYDVTNSKIITPSPAKIQKTSLAERPFFEFQSSPNATSYRISFVVVGTSTTAYTVDFDEIEVGPKEYLSNNIITDPVPVTFTGSWITNTTYTGTVSRVGAYADFECKVALSGPPNDPAATPLYLNLPSGYVIDTSKLLDSGVNYQTFPSSVTILDVGVSLWGGEVSYRNPSAVDIFVQTTSATYLREQTSVTNTTPHTFADGDRIVIKFRVPIVGWSSGTEVQNIYTNRDVSFGARRSSSQAVSGGGSVILAFDSELYDTTNSYNNSTGRFTAPTSGKYSFKSNIRVSIGASAPSQAGAYFKINGSGSGLRGNSTKEDFVANKDSMLSIQADIDLQAGDYVEVEVYSVLNGLTIIGGTDDNACLYAHKIQSPAQITAAEKVTEHYRTNTGSYATGATILYGTSVTSTHGAYNPSTGVFTAPKSGKLRVHASILISSTSTSYSILYVRTSAGSAVKQGPIASNIGSIGLHGPSVYKEFDVIQGDQYKITYTHGIGGSVSLDASDTVGQYNEVIWSMD